MDATPEKTSLVEKRRRYIERMQRLRTETVDVDVAGRAPEGSGPPNRHGMPQLPVGQHEVKTWPVLDLGVHPEIEASAWTLEVGGLVENPLTLGWDDLRALPQEEQVSDFHCVTTWSRMDNRFEGISFRTLAQLVVPKPEARFVFCTGSDVEPDSGEAYTTSLALERALDPDVMLVHTWEGEPLPRDHGGPVRMITPRLYAWKGTKWIRRIELLAEDRLGFWERRGYSNTARPWFEDRYSS